MARVLERGVVHVRAGVVVVHADAVACLVRRQNDQEQPVRGDYEIAVSLDDELELIYLQRARQLPTNASAAVEGDLGNRQVFGVCVGQQQLLDVLLHVLVDYLLLGYVPQQHVSRLGADDVGGVGGDDRVRHDRTVRACR